MMTHERLIRLPEVCRRVGMSRSPIYKRIKDGSFPLPVKNGRMSMWKESEIDKYVAKVCGEEVQH